MKNNQITYVFFQLTGHKFKLYEIVEEHKNVQEDLRSEDDVRMASSTFSSKAIFQTEVTYF